jgi:hypothetical protein
MGQVHETSNRFERLGEGIEENEINFLKEGTPGK